MKSHEVLKEACQEQGCKAVAAALGVSHSLMNKWTESRPDGRSVELNPLDRVTALVAVTGDERLLEHLCQEAGGEFVRPGELPALVLRCLSRFKAEIDAFIKQWQTKKKKEAGEWRTKTFGCRHRLPGGRCGFKASQRN